MLEIEYVSPDSLKPYKNNARKHEAEDVEAIMQSIKDFGFNDPIGVWGKANNIVEGHGRLLAAQELGLEKVPIIHLDHLSNEQRRAYALAHNKTAELSEWDEALKKSELKAIKSYDMRDYGFSALDLLDFDDDEDEPEEDEEDEEDDDGYYGDERERTFETYNLKDYDASRVAGPFDLPTLQACSVVPSDLIGFNYVLSTSDRTKGVHFFLDDYQFERIWNDPSVYIAKLLEFPCVLTPDFSLYTDMPKAMKIWNVYRSRLIGQMMQDYGVNVIPTLQYAGDDTLDWCFEGIAGGGTVAVSTVGVMKDSEARKIWTKGMRTALEQIQPKTVVCYGAEMKDFDFAGADVVTIKSRSFT